MTNEISFMGANFVAQQVDWNMTEGWGQGARAAEAYYEPLDTFPARFDALLADVTSMGFTVFDVWTGQLGWTWATPEHLAAARDLLDKHGVRVASYAGSYGTTPEEFARACQVATSLGAPILGGRAKLLETDRPTVVRMLAEHDLYLAIENHPEKTPAEMLAQIGDGADGRIGTAADTGWYGTQGYDAARAIEELGEHMRYVHLKDVLAAGAHDTCRFGAGIVPIQGCVRAIKDVGYTGAVSVEHEPHHSDPHEDCVASRDLLQTWLAA